MPKMTFDEIAKITDVAERDEKVAEFAREEHELKKAGKLEDEPKYAHSKPEEVDDGKTDIADTKDGSTVDTPDAGGQAKEQGKELDTTDKTEAVKETNDTDSAPKDTGDKIEEKTEPEDPKPAEEPKQFTADEIKKYAEENKMDIAESQKELESIQKIYEKYGGDVTKIKKDDSLFKLAKATLYALRMNSQSQQKLKELSEKQAVRFAFEKDHVIWDGKKVQKAELVQLYRDQYPANTEVMDDDQVYENAQRDMRTRLQSAAKDSEVMIKKEADTKRLLLVNDIPDSDVKFAPYIKDFLEKIPDDKLVAKDFSMDVILNLARGEKYHDDIKDAYQKGLAEGKKQVKSIEEKSAPQAKKPVVTEKSYSLSGDQKEKALAMFQNTNVSNERAYELYAEFLKDREKAKERLKRKTA